MTNTKYSPRTELVLHIVKRVLIYLMMTVFAVIMLIPFYWSIITALRPYTETIKIPVSFVPHEVSLEYFTQFFTAQIGTRGGKSFASATGYTLLITVVGIFTNLFFGGLAGYTFARMQFRGRQLIFKIMLASLMLPSVVTMLPQYYIVNVLGLNGTWMAVVLPGAVGVYGIFFTRQFYHGIPAAYGEAARIDGAGEFRIYWQIYLPQVTSGLITLGIITFNSYWNSYLWPSLVLRTGNVTMLSLILGDYQQLTQGDYGAICAGALVVMAPSLLLYAFLQKYFMNTVTFAGVKE